MSRDLVERARQYDALEQEEAALSKTILEAQERRQQIIREVNALDELVADEMQDGEIVACLLAPTRVATLERKGDEIYVEIMTLIGPKQVGRIVSVEPGKATVAAVKP